MSHTTLNSALYRGAGHSTGGHCSTRRTSFTSWRAEIARLNELGLSPYVMQSNMDFTIEGSLSANCHGWQANARPMGNYVTELTIDQHDGKGLRELSKGNPLRKAVIGGYGLCGEIKHVTYEKINNFCVESFVDTGWADEVCDKNYTSVDMLNIHLDRKWKQAIVNRHYYCTDEGGTVSELNDHVPWWVPKMVRYAQPLRWFAQKNTKLHQVRSRNELLYTSVRHFQWPGQGLAEFFIPVGNCMEFVGMCRPIVKNMNIYNTTVRDVLPDESSMMPYATKHVRGFVMLFKHQPNNMHNLRRMLDIALGLGGSYYLPYTMSYDYVDVGQFRHAYPNWSEFASHMVSTSKWADKFIAGEK